MVKPLGGRGRKVPWSSKVVRVPEPLLDTVNTAIEDFYRLMDSDLTLTEEEGIPSIQSKSEAFPSQSEVIEQAKKILKSRKSAKISILKLLQVIYGDSVTEQSLTE